MTQDLLDIYSDFLIAISCKLEKRERTPDGVIAFVFLSPLLRSTELRAMVLILIHLKF
jgi:hypothetical protein